MLIPLPGGIGGGHDLREPRGSRYGRRPPGLDDRPGNAFGETLLAVAPEHVCDIGLGGARQPCGGGLAVKRIHAHIERTFAHKTKTPLRRIQLRRRHTEVEHHPVHLARYRPGFRKVLQHGERPLKNAKTAIPRQPFPGRLHRPWILVDGDEASTRTEPLQYRSAMAAPPEGRVHIHAVGANP